MENHEKGECKKILVLSGGGIKGLITAKILTEIEERIEQPIITCFDEVIGTSTGAIIACGLVIPSKSNASMPFYKALDLLNFYRDHASTIFPYKLHNKVKRVIRIIKGLFGPVFPYDHVPLETVLESYFGNYRLSDGIRNIEIKAIGGRIINDHMYHGLCFFGKDDLGSYFVSNNEKWETERIEADFYLRDVTRGASAAVPLIKTAFFSSICKQTYDLFCIDAGAIENTPVQNSAIASIYDKGNDYFILSLGTGNEPKEKLKLWRWRLPILGPLFKVIDQMSIREGVALDIAEQAGEFSNVEFMQLNPNLEEKINFLNSSPDAMKKMEDYTDDYINKNNALIEEICNKILGK